MGKLMYENVCIILNMTEYLSVLQDSVLVSYGE